MTASRTEFPFAQAPASGDVTEVAPGILWARLPMPFRLNHVNIFLIEDGDGWAIFDTGLADSVTQSTWEKLLRGRRITKVIASHHHPDHIGLAGWLCDRLEVPLLTSQTSYLSSANMILDTRDGPLYFDYYTRHGLSGQTADLVGSDGHRYLQRVTALPPTFFRLLDGDTVEIGARSFKVLTADGHAPEQVMLYAAEDRIFLAADHVMTQITPNVSVWAPEPEGDPLGLYLKSMDRIISEIEADVLVLPGHHLPFIGLHERCRQLVSHHHERCDQVAAACTSRWLSVSELMPILFGAISDPHQIGFAFSETHAHVNHMLRQGTLVAREGAEGVRQVGSAMAG